MEVLRKVLHNKDDMSYVKECYEKHPPEAAAFDTETDGLHIIKCRPFFFQFGWWNKTQDIIYAFAIDLRPTAHMPWRDMVSEWYAIVKSAPVYLAHNVKYDLHMMANIGLPYWHGNLSDTQFYIRLAHDNISKRFGGVGLALKDYASKYVDRSAAYHEKEIKSYRSQLAKKYNRQLKDAMGWPLYKIDDFFKDATVESMDFPDVESLIAYTNWKNSLPEELRNIRGKVSVDDIPYTLVPTKLLSKYALEDIVLTLKVYKTTAPVVKDRGNTEALLIENACIRPLWEMERHGLPVDSGYVEESYWRTRTYIRRRRQDLIDLTGMDVTANQSKVILEYLKDSGLKINSTNSSVLDHVISDSPDHPAVPVIECVQELRTLEKWMSTYLLRFRGEDRIYTQINQVGAASLRMSSDFQQFPKGGIYDAKGNELFNPRRAILTDGRPTVYIDYSQIELRVQALYTILLDNPDTNLCRAYMPYECVKDGIEYDYTKASTRAMWTEPGWVLKENPTTSWVPTDVHGATTKAAFGIDESDKRYKSLRALGKRVNFAKNYGAQVGCISNMFPDQDAETIKAIDQGYYSAFPGIRTYQNYCYQLANYQPYATNLFGIKYWGVSGHNLINMLIQGASATLLKKAILKVYEFLSSGNYKTKMIIPVHDEVQFDMPEDELHLIPTLKEIMEDWPDSLIPIVADIEITRKSWADKEDYDV